MPDNIENSYFTLEAEPTGEYDYLEGFTDDPVLSKAIHDVINGLQNRIHDLEYELATRIPEVIVETKIEQIEVPLPDEWEDVKRLRQQVKNLQEQLKLEQAQTIRLYNNPSAVAMIQKWEQIKKENETFRDVNYRGSKKELEEIRLTLHTIMTKTNPVIGEEDTNAERVSVDGYTVYIEFLEKMENEIIVLREQNELSTDELRDKNWELDKLSKFKELLPELIEAGIVIDNGDLYLDRGTFGFLLDRSKPVKLEAVA